MANNIHPVFDKILNRNDKETLLDQTSVCLWLTGLSGSGKSTVAAALEKRLHAEGFLTQILDGDNIRSGLNNNLSFSAEDRTENIRRIAELTKLYVNSGIISICSFVSPTREIRAMARDIIGPEDFKEVYINASIEVCESRDVKGLYKKARAGEIKNFTGIDAPYEAPIEADLTLESGTESLDESVAKLFRFVLPLVQK